MRQRTVLKRAAKKWPKGVDASRAVDAEENDALRADLQDMLSGLEERISGGANKPATRQDKAMEDIMAKRALGAGGVPSTLSAIGSEVGVTK